MVSRGTTQVKAGCAAASAIIARFPRRSIAAGELNALRTPLPTPAVADA